MRRRDQAEGTVCSDSMASVRSSGPSWSQRASRRGPRQGLGERRRALRQEEAPKEVLPGDSGHFLACYS